MQKINKQWADEIDGAEPDPRLELFFLACMLKLGHPKNIHTDEFYGYIVEFHNSLGKPIPPWQGPTTLALQYTFWYERQTKSVS